MKARLTTANDYGSNNASRRRASLTPLLLLFLLDPIVISFGQTWTPTAAPATNWSALACSADGSRLAAAVFHGPIYISTNSGMNWAVSSAPVTNWSAVASSADGSRLVAAVGGPAYYPGPVFFSTKHPCKN